VPGRGSVTVEELLTLPDDGYSYEVVEGVLVRMAGTGKQTTRLALDLGAELRAYIRPRRLGGVTGADGVYKFPGAETGLLPDAGFYTAERDAEAPDDAKPIPFAPDLAVEVVSPDQSADAMAAKVRRYLRAGTRLVWVVWPLAKHIDVWRPQCSPDR
jgi:Uma2 family endonuclease